MLVTFHNKFTILNTTKCTFQFFTYFSTSCFVLGSLVLQTGGADRENVPQIQTSLFVKQLIVGAFSYSHFEAVVAVILCL